jgi:predicted Zn-dependent peptidase
MVSAVLGLRRGSRLHRSLVREQQIAADASAFTYDLSKGADLLVIDATARPGVSASALEAAVAAELDALRTDGVRESELIRAKAIVETDYLTAMQSAQDRADRLSMYATYFDDPTRVNTELDRFRAVTVEEVNTFTQEFLGENNRASLSYVPRPSAAEVV